MERRLSPSNLKARPDHQDPERRKEIKYPQVTPHALLGSLLGVLAEQQRAPFETHDSVELKFLSFKTMLLVMLTSIKRFGDLQAFLVNKSYLEFGPPDSQVTLSPQPDYVPKVFTTPFWDQVVKLQALPLQEADPVLVLLCPIYVESTQGFRCSDQLLVCFGV